LRLATSESSHSTDRLAKASEAAANISSGIISRPVSSLAIKDALLEQV